MRNIYLKDLVGKIINDGDYLVWASPRQGYGMQICRCVGFTPRMIYVEVIGKEGKTRIMPHHAMVITDQLVSNDQKGTAVELDAPAIGRDLSTGGMTPGQTASSWFASRGVTVDEFLEVLRSDDG